MLKVTMREAKTRLSKLVGKTVAGEPFIIAGPESRIRLKAGKLHE